jgi:hypothetical protein
LKPILDITGFNLATRVCRFDQILLDLCQELENAVTVLNMVGALGNGHIHQAVTYPIDAVAFGDDWGMQIDGNRGHVWCCVVVAARKMAN